MSVTAVRKDARAHTLRIEAEFEATPARVWQLWADPRQLERWWGPPTYPATVDAHDLRAGGRVAYHMTGPEGDQPRGYWEVLEVEPSGLLVEQAQHDALAVARGDRRDADVDGAPCDAQRDAAVLGQALLGDVELRHDLDARDDDRRDGAARLQDFLEHAV